MKVYACRKCGVVWEYVPRGAGYLAAPVEKVNTSHEIVHIDLCHECRPVEMTYAEEHDLWAEVLQSGRGDFLKAFAHAFLRADEENLRLLRPVSAKLIEKYGLKS